jgi:predicted transposase YbfD/YdcC
VRQHSWRPTGFTLSATGVGVSGALITSDAMHCQKVVAFIDDKRFMTGRLADEISDHVRQSVQEVRAYCVNAQYLPTDPIARSAIKEIARATRQYIQTATPGAHPQILEAGLLALRKRIGVQLLALVEKYNLECDIDLAEFREDGVALLEKWFRADPYPLAQGPNDVLRP